MQVEGRVEVIGFGAQVSGVMLVSELEKMK